jgi:hypothetical protein
MVWAAIRNEIYTKTHQHEFREGNICGECREHGRYEKCRENFGLKISMEDLAVNGRKVIK